MTPKHEMKFYRCLMTLGVILGMLTVYSCAHTPQEGDAAAKGEEAKAKAAEEFVSASGAKISKSVVSAFLDAQKRAAKKPLERSDIMALRGMYESIVSDAPQFAEAWVNLGLSYERLGDLEKAGTHYQKAITLAPKYLPACTRMASWLDQNGRGKEGLGILSPCLRDAPPPTTKNNSQAAEALVVQSRLKWQMGKKEETLKDLQEAVYHNPEETGALVMRADIHQVQHEFEQAKRLYEQALAEKTVTNPASIYNALARCNWELKDSASALAAWEEAKKHDPTLTEPYRRVGQVALLSGDYGTAEKNFRKLLDLDGRDFDSLIQLGVALRMSGRAKDAESEYQKALRLNPKNPLVVYNLGILYHQFLDQPDLGLRYYDQYRSLGGVDANTKEFQALVADAQRKRDGKAQAATIKNAPPKEEPKPAPGKSAAPAAKIAPPAAAKANEPKDQPKSEPTGKEEKRETSSTSPAKN